MTQARHPEQREGSPEHGTLPIPEIPHVVRDNSMDPATLRRLLIEPE
jgi:hypothetical protein